MEPCGGNFVLIRLSLLFPFVLSITKIYGLPFSEIIVKLLSPFYSITKGSKYFKTCIPSFNSLLNT